MSIPRIVIAGTRSGDGKTTVATGLLAALRGRGDDVSGHKVGPDYIDPGYHAAASGRPGRNLDPWLCGEELIAPLFAHGAASDLALIEGVMGLFDGASGRGDFASTAHVARLLRAPVVLVVNASGMSRSVAATVRGFLDLDPTITVAGVILNQISSPRHEETLREALGGIGVPVLGALPREATLHTPSRHLGLVPAAERDAATATWLPHLAALVRAHVDLDAIARIARAAPPLTTTAWSPDRGARHDGVRVAVAAGPAFTFGYTEHVELLEAAGADVVTFDPLCDEALPTGTDALVVGGGFPEVYAPQLAGNITLREDVRTRVRAGLPTVAECAGLLWLARELDGRPQCGVLDTTGAMTSRLTLGYREATVLTDNPIAAAGTAVRAHEFHRTATAASGGTPPAFRVAGANHGWAGPSLLASYLHLHWAGVPGAADRLLAGAEARRVVSA